MNDYQFQNASGKAFDNIECNTTQEFNNFKFASFTRTLVIIFHTSKIRDVEPNNCFKGVAHDIRGPCF